MRSGRRARRGSAGERDRQPALCAELATAPIVEGVQNGRMGAGIDELRRLRRARDRMDRARTAAMSPSHFSRRFRETYAETPYSYLMTRRIERAKALLRRGDLSVTEVCFAVGWSSLGSFCARFGELVGEPPSTYRARDHEELRVFAPCQAMVITRPRRGGGRRAESRSFGEASIEVRTLSSAP
jgi:AraC-like DNA-binding protein